MRNRSERFCCWIAIRKDGLRTFNFQLLSIQSFALLSA